MERETKKVSFGFSWADEVEREEHEEEQKATVGDQRSQEKTARKPNPFGDARPREVVLQEKGVDWRKIDREMDQISTLRNDRKVKENIPLTTASILRQEHLSSIARCPDRSKSEPCNSLVAPLKYPPKDISSLMNAGLGNSHQKKYLHNSAMKREREHVNSTMKWERERMNFNCSAVTYHAHDTMQHWPLQGAHSFSMEREGHMWLYPNTDITSLRQDMGPKPKRKWYGERFIGAMEETQAIGTRQVLLDLNMERTGFPVNYNVGKDYYLENNDELYGRKEYVEYRRFAGKREGMQANSRQDVEHKSRRKWYGKRYIGEKEETHAIGARQVLVDSDMERTGFRVNCNVGDDYCLENIDELSGREEFVEYRRLVGEREEMQANSSRQDVEYKSRRKWYGERHISATEETHAIGARQVLVDRDMERTGFGVNCNVGDDYYLENIDELSGREEYRRFVGEREEMQASGRRPIHMNQKMEMPRLGKKYMDDNEYWEYIEDQSSRRNYDKGLISPSTEPRGWRYTQRDFDAERCRFGGTGYGGDATLGKLDYSTVEVIDRERQGQVQNTVSMRSANNNKKKKRRHGKQAKK